MEGFKAIEDLLSGPAPYQGLASPKWPAVFPPLSQEKVTKGAALYKQHCESCHQPPVNELMEDMKSAQPQHWWKNKQGKQFLVVKDVKMEYMRTDPHEAGDFITRTADSGGLGKGRISAEDGLRLVTSGMAANFFDSKGFTPSNVLSGVDTAIPVTRSFAPRPSTRPVRSMGFGPWLPTCITGRSQICMLYSHRKVRGQIHSG